MSEPAASIDAPAADDLWIFAYGSLMWRPDFPYLEATHARLTGFSRQFCIYSVVHRGTPERPGLVLGLDRGGICDGMAFKVAAQHVPATLNRLRIREQVTGVYRETHVRVGLSEGQHKDVPALAYVVERAHPSYAPRLSLSHQAEVIRAGAGGSGDNLDYLFNTLRHLRALGIRERGLERLAVMIGPLFANITEAEGAMACRRIHALTRAEAATPVHGRRLRRDERVRFAHRRPKAT